MTTRSQRIAAGPAKVARRRPTIEPIVETCELLTPIFGGGPQSDKPGDEITPIRGASVRGQLRFWWRATRGGGKSLDELAKMEGRLWGTASSPGLVTLEIDDSKLRRARETPSSKLGYITFPLQPEAGAPARQVNRYDGVFTISLCFVGEPTQEDRAGVVAALWAWRNFGGIGGRTRRGFGAISIDKSVTDFSSSVLNSSLIINEEPPKGVPSLAPITKPALITAKSGKAQIVWEDLVTALKHFRQGPNLGQNPGDGHPGRSLWPEPDFIRSNTGNPGYSKHKRRVCNVDAAPRAQFGLPIIFDFKKEISPKLTLKLADADRFASPLIIRPIGSRDKAVAVALVLGNRPNLDEIPGGCQFEQGKKRTKVKTTLTADEAEAIAPMKGSGTTDPLLAFLHYLKSKTANR